MAKMRKKRQITEREGSSALSPNTRDERIRAILKALRIAYQSVRTHSQWVEENCGVSAAQLWAMWELFSTPGQRVSDLAAALVLHVSTASNMLDKLEQKNLIRRERLGPDQRVVRLYLTPEGTDILATAPRPAQGPVTEALQRLPDEVLIALGVNLGELVALLKLKNQEAALTPLSEAK